MVVSILHFLRASFMEEIDVPSHFLCPISLQIMRDPVTVSTGITYDRESIEKWLSSSSSSTKQRTPTCPVTKQPLCNDWNLTPNHTLRRLIQGWCTLNASHGVERIPTPKPQVDRSHVAKLLKEAKKSPTSQLHCLSTLKSLVLESERNKTYLQDAGALEFLTSMLKNDVDAIVEEAVEVISNINASDTLLREVLRNNSGIIDTLLAISKTGSFQSRGSAIAFLKSIYGVADQTQKTSTRDDLFSELMRAINDQISQQATKSALQILFLLSPLGRNRTKAVKSGAVFHLVELLLNSSVGRECELAMVVLDQLCDCAEGRAELLRHGGGLAVLAKKMLRVSHLANEKAVRIVHSICKYSATSGVLHEMMEVGVVSKLCLMLQVVGGSSKVRKRVKDILHLHQCVWKISSCIPISSLSW